MRISSTTMNRASATPSTVPGAATRTRMRVSNPHRPQSPRRVCGVPFFGVIPSADVSAVSVIGVLNVYLLDNSVGSAWWGEREAAPDTGCALEACPVRSNRAVCVFVDTTCVCNCSAPRRLIALHASSQTQPAQVSRNGCQTGFCELAQRCA